MGARKRLRAENMKEARTTLAFARLNDSPIAPRKMIFLRFIIEFWVKLYQIIPIFTLNDAIENRSGIMPS
jgi:hypothetical protein